MNFRAGVLFGIFSHFLWWAIQVYLLPVKRRSSITTMACFWGAGNIALLVFWQATPWDAHEFYRADCLYSFGVTFVTTANGLTVRLPTSRSSATSLFRVICLMFMVFITYFAPLCNVLYDIAVTQPFSCYAGHRHIHRFYCFVDVLDGRNRCSFLSSPGDGQARPSLVGWLFVIR